MNLRRNIFIAKWAIEDVILGRQIRVVLPLRKAVKGEEVSCGTKNGLP